MEFRLNGRNCEITEDVARTRICASIPDRVQVHWVEVDGRRWPPKQAFEVASGISRSEYTSHIALRLLRRLGFETSDIPIRAWAPPSTAGDHPAGVRAVATAVPTPTSVTEAANAFAALDAFLQRDAFRLLVSNLEGRLDGVERAAALAIASETPFSMSLIDAALVVRERVGVLDSVIHVSVITQVIPFLLEDGERLVKRPSLGAGNDKGRPFDLETDRRVAEFKLSSWKGADGMRQRGLFADLVGLTLDDTGRKRQMYVVGALPKTFLQTSRANAIKKLSKSALRDRALETMSDKTTVAEFTAQSEVEIIDLKQWLPGLR